jgi:hypothetical protein
MTKVKLGVLLGFAVVVAGLAALAATLSGRGDHRAADATAAGKAHVTKRPNPSSHGGDARGRTFDAASIFPAGSVWNRRLADDAPLVSDRNPRLARMMRESLLFQGRRDRSRPPPVAGGTFVQPAQRGAPTWIASTRVKPVPFILDNAGAHAKWLRAELARGVPIPAGARPATGNTDATFKVWQPDWRGPLTAATGAHGKLWELWRVSSPQQNAPGAGPLPWPDRDGRPAQSHGDSRWHAVYGGVLNYTSESPGYSVDRRGESRNGTFAPPSDLITVRAARRLPDTERRTTTTSASGLPLSPRPITFSDWDRGYIDHVMGWSLRDHPCRDDPSTGIRRFVWPAQFASDCHEAPPGYPRAAIGYGQRFRIPADAKMPRGLPKFAGMVWTAARDYGVMFTEGAPSGIAVVLDAQPTGDPSVPSENLWYRRKAFGAKPLEPWRMGEFIASFLSQMVPLAPPSARERRAIVAPADGTRVGSK